MKYHGIEIGAARLRRLCQNNGIRRLALFGSILRHDFGPDSDIDILVEFEPGRTPGFLKMAALEQELAELLGRKTDLRTPAELSKYFREEVLRECDVQYAA